MEEGVSNGATNGTNHHVSKASNGDHSATNSLELPHITSNILPLSNIFKFYCQESFKQLQTIIENLSMSRDRELDVIRKRKLLNVIISIRQDFIKIYTLVKWATKSKDISTLIDLLNWFRTQEFYFEQLNLGLNELNGFSGAKLPNSDLVTSMEVLVKGRPQLPSYNMVPHPSVSAEKMLSVLKELNLALTARMALSRTVPEEFMRNYSVKDGRITFTLSKKYQARVTVGNDMVLDSDEEYQQLPYFLIDFSFLFGVVAENILKTGISTKLPATFWPRLEKQGNAVLLTENLAGLYRFLNRFTKKFKFNLIYQQQLKNLNHLKWRNLKYHMANDKIVINYWNSPDNSIELSLDDNFDIGFVWHKRGELMPDVDITVDNDEFDVEHLLNQVLNKHCGSLITSLARTNDSFLLINPYQVLIQLTASKNAIFSIDSLTGQFYFTEPNRLQVQVSKKINTFNYNGKEHLLVEFIHRRFIELKLATISKEIKNKLITIEWISNHIISLKDDELAKLNPKLLSSVFQIQYFKCKNWPSLWFLISVVDDSEFQVEWYVSRIKSVKGEWRLERVSNLELSHNDLDFSFFNSLAGVCLNKIIDSMLIQELTEKKIKFVEVGQTHELVKKFQFDDTQLSKGYETVFLLYNNGQYLPVKNSSNTLALKIELLNNKDNKHIKVILRSRLMLQSNEFQKLNLDNIRVLDINGSQFIEIVQEINLGNNELNLQVNILEDVFISVYKLNYLITLMNELLENNVEVLEFTQHITVKVNEVFKKIYIDVADQHVQYYYYKYDDDEREDIKLILNYINKAICTDKYHSFSSVVTYLQQMTPIVEGIRELQSLLQSKNTHKLTNGIHKLTFDVKLVNLNNIQLLFGLNHLAAGNKKVQKDKIMLTLKFKINKFKVGNKLDLNISLIDNINIKNLKYKKLFELIFKTLSGNDEVTNLNYDFIIGMPLVGKFLVEIGNCLLTYVETEG